MPNFAARSSTSSMLVCAVSGAHRPESRDGPAGRLGRIRQAWTRPTAATRGILGPEAIGRVFTLRRTPPGRRPRPPRSSATGSCSGTSATARRTARRSSRTRASTSSSSRTAPPCTASIAAATSRILAGQRVGRRREVPPRRLLGLPRPPRARDHRPRGAAADRVRPGRPRPRARAPRPRPAPDDKLALTEAFLRARMPRARPRGRRSSRRSWSTCSRSTPGSSVEEIARRHAVSTRTLQRLFRRHVGVGPKWVLRRYRLQEAAEQLAAGERSDWTRLALDLGYFDHAHFIRDFRAVVGRSPSEYEAMCAALARRVTAVTPTAAGPRQPSTRQKFGYRGRLRGRPCPPSLCPQAHRACRAHHARARRCLRRCMIVMTVLWLLVPHAGPRERRGWIVALTVATTPLYVVVVLRRAIVCRASAMNVTGLVGIVAVSVLVWAAGGLPLGVRAARAVVPADQRLHAPAPRRRACTSPSSSPAARAATALSFERGPHGDRGSLWGFAVVAVATLVVNTALVALPLRPACARRPTTSSAAAPQDALTGLANRAALHERLDAIDVRRAARGVRHRRRRLQVRQRLARPPRRRPPARARRRAPRAPRPRRRPPRPPRRRRVRPRGRRDPRRPDRRRGGRAPRRQLRRSRSTSTARRSRCPSPSASAASPTPRPARRRCATPTSRSTPRSSSGAAA